MPVEDTITRHAVSRIVDTYGAGESGRLGLEQVQAFIVSDDHRLSTGPEPRPNLRGSSASSGSKSQLALCENRETRRR
jgi:hypothetical protein